MTVRATNMPLVPKWANRAFAHMVADGRTLFSAARRACDVGVGAGAGAGAGAGVGAGVGALCDNRYAESEGAPAA